MGQGEARSLYVSVEEASEHFGAKGVEFTLFTLAGKAVELQRKICKVGHIGVEFLFVEEGGDVGIVWSHTGVEEVPLSVIEETVCGNSAAAWFIF